MALEIILSFLIFITGCTCGIKITSPPIDSQNITSNDYLSTEIEYTGSCREGDCQITTFHAYLDDQDITDIFTCTPDDVCSASAASLPSGNHILRVDANINSDTYMCRVGSETDTHILHVCSPSQWVNTYEIGRSETISTVQQTTDGGYIATGIDYWNYDADVLILKLSSTGYVQWINTYDGPDWGAEESTDYVNSIEQTVDGGYIMVGMSGPHQYSYPNFYAWVIKLTGDGTVQWEKSFNPSYEGSANAVEQTDDDGDGNRDDGYVVVGMTAAATPNYSNAFVLKLDGGGNILWLKSYASDIETTYGRSIQQTTEGGYIVAGYGSEGGWVIKLDVNGTPLWQKAYSGADLNAIEQTNDGGYVVAGSTADGGLILKLDGNGDIIWQNKYGSTGGQGQAFYSVHQEADNSYIVGGVTTLLTAKHPDAWMLKLDETGNIQWQRTYEYVYSNGFYSQNAVHKTSDGGYIAATDKSIFKLDANGTVKDCDIIGQSNAQKSNTEVTIQDLTSPTGDPGLDPSMRIFDVGNRMIEVEEVCCY